ncbi:TlpA disulfide reductase family protein [Pontibacter oryzae]|nr:TlpA disulfide reductase family protein [Pontibacter oryzae]
MKKLTPLLATLLLLFTHQLLAQGKAVISGKITNPLDDYVALVTYANPLIPDEKVTEVELDGDSFRIEVPVQEATVAELLHGDEVVQVYLEPGYDLKLTVNGGKFFKTIKYNGKGANENNYLAYATARFDEEQDYQVLPDNIKLKAGEFTEFLDYRRADQLKSLDKYAAKYTLSEKFRSFILTEIEFGYAKDKLNYHPLREQALQLKLTKPEASFYTFLEQLDLQRPQGHLSPAYVSFLQDYTFYYAQQAGSSKESEQFYKACYDVAGQKLQGAALMMAQAQVLKQSIQFGHLKYTQQLLKDFIARNPDQALNTYLKQLSNANKSLAPGSMAPDFTAVDTAGNTVALSNFKGKLIYLNFWKSDCGLCLMELPHLQQLIGKLNAEKVVFVNVALDETPEKWRQLVEQKQLQGEQLYAGDQASDLMQRYNLKDVPAYFLVDENGQLANLKASHPNHPETIRDLLNYLELHQASLK